MLAFATRLGPVLNVRTRADDEHMPCIPGPALKGCCNAGTPGCPIDHCARSLVSVAWRLGALVPSAQGAVASDDFEGCVQ